MAHMIVSQSICMRRGSMYKSIYHSAMLRRRVSSAGRHFPIWVATNLRGYLDDQLI